MLIFQYKRSFFFALGNVFVRVYGQELEQFLLIKQNQAVTYTLLYIFNETKSYVHFGYLFVNQILD